MVETPNFLTFKEQLIQIWFNHYTIILVLILIKTYLFKLSLLNSLQDLKVYSQSSIQQFNAYSNNIATLPYQYSQILNGLIQQKINDMKFQVLTLVIFTINIIIGIVKLLIQIFFGTFICLFDGLVNGFIDFALDLVETILKDFSAVVKASTTIIATGIEGLSKLVTDVSLGINLITKFFSNRDVVNVNGLIHNFNDSISILNDFSLPSSVYQRIDSLKDKVPSFDDLEDDFFAKLESPLTKLIHQFNTLHNFAQLSYPNISMPVARFRAIDESLLDRFFDDSKIAINESFKIIMILLILLSVLAMIFLAVRDYFLWKKKYTLFVEVRNEPLDEFKFLNLLNWFSNTFVYYAKNLFHLHNRTVWFISYITSPYSLTLLGITLAGFFAILLQYCLLKVFLRTLVSFPMQKLSNDLSKSLVLDTATFVRNTNAYIEDQQRALNAELFGSITNSTSHVSEIINSMVSNLNHTLIEPFDSTPFAAPINTVVYCIITKKLVMIEDGLSWITHNLNIDLPHLPLSFEQDLNRAMAQHAVSGSIVIQPYIDRMVQYYKKSLLFECIIFSGLFGLWLLQFVIGVGYHCYRAKRYQTIGCPKPLTVREKLAYEFPFTNVNIE